MTTDKNLAVFRVKNVSMGTRMIQTAGGKHVSLSRGEEKDLKLHGHVARRHADAAARRPGRYMEIAPTDDDSRALLSGVSLTEDTGGAPTAPGAERIGAVPASDKAAARKELADRAESMDINELRSEARLQLGEAWPRRGGQNLTRDQIKQMLLEGPSSPPADIE